MCPTTSCASCTASSTCSRTRPSSWRATSSERPRAILKACSRRSSRHCSTMRKTARTAGIAPATPAAWRF
ncbi:DUF6862 domain-containing protein [Acidovorax sp. NO-1]|uniref:DUF6862 domain-containing protein n=1 Tax=Acidovorax sp. NO-1 TaxID=512030 RepID=UPI00351017CE